MEAARAPEVPRPRELPGEKAARIVEAMRVSVAARGVAGSTFDHVAGEAGVSRGLLHYYFATKERLLLEVVRRECDMRNERLDSAIAGADSADDVLDALVRNLEEFLGEGPASSVMFFEMVTLAQRNAEVASELAEVGRRMRSHLAAALRAKADVAVLRLRADPDAAAGFLFALADGVITRRLSEPDFDIGPLMGLAVKAARALLG